MPRAKPRKNERAIEFIPEFKFPSEDWNRIARVFPKNSKKLRIELETIGSLFIEDQWARSVSPSDREMKAMLDNAYAATIKFEEVITEIDSRTAQAVDAKLYRKEKNLSEFHRQLKRSVYLYRSAVAEARSGLRPRKDSKVTPELQLAVRVAQALESKRIKPTIYDNGIWADLVKTILRSSDHPISNVRHLLTQASALGW